MLGSLPWACGSYTERTIATHSGALAGFAFSMARVRAVLALGAVGSLENSPNTLPVAEAGAEAGAVKLAPPWIGSAEGVEGDGLEVDGEDCLGTVGGGKADGEVGFNAGNGVANDANGGGGEEAEGEGSGDGGGDGDGADKGDGDVGRREAWTSGTDTGGSSGCRMARQISHTCTRVGY